jgi:hypothetical protein
LSVFFLHPTNYASPSTETYQTVAGRTMAPHGAIIYRRLAVYLDNNTLEPIAIMESVPPLGEFSVTVGGLAITKYTVVCKGELGEQDKIYSGVSA